MSDVWFAIPSANPENCRKVLPRWREMGYKIAVLQNFARGDIPADRVMWRDSYPGWGDSINILCRELVPKDAPIVVSGGDDMLPDPNHSAAEIAAQFKRHFPDLFGVMQPQGDDFEATAQFCGSPWLGRAWIDRMYGGVGPMYPGYRHFWADEELLWVSKGLGALWIRNDLTQFHDHFRRNSSEKPAYWVQNVERNDRADTQLFIARGSLGFPGHEPIGTPAARMNHELLSSCVVRAREYWDQYHAYAGQELASAKLSEAFERLAEDGVSRVLIFGAGRHTTRASPALRSPKVQVIGFVDDDPKLRDTLLWNLPVFSVAQAATTSAEAVILSSDAHEDKLAQAAAPLARAGMRIVRLYSKDSDRTEPAFALSTTEGTLA